MLQQQQTDDELCVFGRTADSGKMLPVFILQLLPGNELRYPQPAVSLIQLPPEGKELGKRGMVLRSLLLYTGIGSFGKCKVFEGVLRKTMQLKHEC